MPSIRRRAFTLIELVVVVIVIGILAAIIVPNTINAGDQARVVATGEDLAAIARAADAHRNATGRWPRDASRAVMPEELASYFEKGDPFLKVVPMGGVYDYDGPSSSRGPRIAIRSGPGNPLPTEAAVRELDALIDDGDPSTGRLRRTGGAVFYSIGAN
jgi:general secretion pathway protein G